MPILNYLIDMDGVLLHGNAALPGAIEFIERLKAKKRKFLILTNNSMYTPGDLAFRLKSIGFDLNETQIFTSALATTLFLKKQQPDGKAFVIGETGLTTLLHNAGYIITDIEPDYVVLGETNIYNYELVKKAVRMILNGARFIATNPDPNGPGEGGIVPGAGAMAALIEKASGVAPIFVGKPNPLMMRTALNYLDVHSENTVMIGDRMDTDIAAGVMSGLDTILVLSGVTRLEDIIRFPYRPTWIKPSVAEIDV
jgi:NagD protein